MTSEIAFNEHLLSRMEYRRDWSIVSVFPHRAVAFVGSQGIVSGGFRTRQRSAYCGGSVASKSPGERSRAGRVRGEYE